jgi:hypothetical protein
LLSGTGVPSATTGADGPTPAAERPPISPVSLLSAAMVLLSTVAVTFEPSAHPLGQTLPS